MRFLLFAIIINNFHDLSVQWGKKKIGQMSLYSIEAYCEIEPVIIYIAIERNRNSWNP